MTATATNQVRYLVAGDVGVVDDIEFAGVADLTGASSVKAFVWRPVGPADTHELTVAVLDAENRVIRVRYGDAEDDWLPSQVRKAAWHFHVQAFWPGLPNPVTSPRRQPVTLRVRSAAPAIVEP